MRSLRPPLVLLTLAGCAPVGSGPGDIEPSPGRQAMRPAPVVTTPAPDEAYEHWQALPADGAPQGREDHTAIWTGSEMIVWGGETRDDGLTALGTGARYSPTTDRWTAMSSVDAPARRDDHAVVWTGFEMIVWGGNQEDEDADLLASGGRYDPDRDTWTPVRSGPLGPRDDATAVWTGNEMIVWGGRALGHQHLRDGARYLPNADRWLSVSTADAPPAREDHTAVWTGSEMIVWGGWNGRDDRRNHLDDGARYDPVTDRWRPMSRDDAPDPREDHTAVWTGNEMIVWGGAVHRYDGDEDILVQLASGAVYNPTTDTWRPMTMSAAAAPREDHVAVWLGDELFIWGGRSGKQQLADGGLYDPRSDHWRSTTLANEPVARWNHTAVFTGEEVIVWGGYAEIYDVAGGRYRP